MLRLLKNRKAQNTMEYALIFAVIIGAFTAMQLYTRRGMQARLKAGADSIPTLVGQQSGDAQVGILFNDKSATQYEPYYYNKGAYSMTNITGEGTEKGTTTQGGGISDLSNATSNRTGSQEVKSIDVAD